MLHPPPPHWELNGEEADQYINSYVGLHPANTGHWSKAAVMLGVLAGLG